jgi:two-component system CheB/CheR fusion protein
MGAVSQPQPEEPARSAASDNAGLAELPRERTGRSFEDAPAAGTREDRLDQLEAALADTRERLDAVTAELEASRVEVERVGRLLKLNATELTDAGTRFRTLFENSRIATLLLDQGLRIENYTPAMAEIFHLIDRDIGRPIADMASRVSYPELSGDLELVLASLSPVEREVGDPKTGQRYLARSLPLDPGREGGAGVVLSLLDVTATAGAKAEAESANRKSQAILESIGEAFFALDQQLRITYANGLALQMWGKRAEDVTGRTFIEVLPQEADGAMMAAMRAAASCEAPVRFEHQAASTGRWLALSIHPTPGGLSVFFLDISERRRAEERQRLMTAELQHRVRNVLAVVRSLAARTLESSEDLESFAAHFDGRLSALARTQAVLARRSHADVDLDELVREELLSHGAHEGGQVRIVGPPVRIPQRMAETLSLALHELATNAVKFGALSQPKGRLAVVWRLPEGGGVRRLVLDWRESGVGLIDTAPVRTGFGRDLIERGLPYDLGAVTSLAFASGGAHCTIDLPFEKGRGPVREPVPC